MRLERAGLWEPQSQPTRSAVAMAHAHGGMRGANMVGDDRDEADAGYRATLRGDAQLANAAGTDSRRLGSVAAER